MQIYFFAISIAGGGKCGRFLWRCQELRLWRRAYKCAFYKNAGDESALFLKQITPSEFASPSLSNAKIKVGRTRRPTFILEQVMGSKACTLPTPSKSIL